MRITPYQLEKLAALNAHNDSESAALKAATAAGERWPYSRLLKLKRSAKDAQRLAREIEKGMERGDLKEWVDDNVVEPPGAVP